MAANTAGLCNSFRLNWVDGTGHNLSSDTIKAALYVANSSIGPGTTIYTTSGEVSGSGYTAGGVTVTHSTAPSLSGTTIIWTPSAIAFPSATLATAFDCCLLYNASRSNKAICVVTFSATTISGAVFTVNMPANAAASALVEIN